MNSIVTFAEATLRISRSVISNGGVESFEAAKVEVAKKRPVMMDLINNIVLDFLKASNSRNGGVPN